MQPIFAQGNSRTLQRLKILRQAAQTDKAPRVALRLQAIMLSVHEGHRSGRPAQLNAPQWEQLADILDSGPVAHGLNTGVWTSPLIAQIIQEEFDVNYHPGHVRHWLKRLDFSVQRPKTRLVQADPKKQNRWIRYTHPHLKKTPKGKGR